MKTVVNVCSPTFYAPESYGRIALELSGGLRARGYYVNEIGDRAGKVIIKPANGSFLLAYPTNFESLFGAISAIGQRIALTMFESTRLPDGWADVLNDCDKLIVPAEFLRGVFADNGVKTPLDVVPLGINPLFGQPYQRSTCECRPIRFLCIGDRGERKNAITAMQAFYRAFGIDTRYHLTVKVRDGAISKVSITNPNIELLSSDMTDAELLNLYLTHDVMIFPTKAEGFGLPPREFAATGGIALATNWGGTADDLDKWGFPIPHTMESAWGDVDKWRGKLGEWATIDVDTLSQQLRDVADNLDRYAGEASAKARWAIENYTWSAFVDQCVRVWEGEDASISK